MDASEAVEYGRVHDQLYPEHMTADNVLPELVLDDLRNRKHTVKGAFGAEQPCPTFAFIPFDANVLSIVMDVNRVAGVVQIVVNKDGKIFGGLLLRVSRWSMGMRLMRTHSCERLAEKWDRCGILIVSVSDGILSIVYHAPRLDDTYVDDVVVHSEFEQAEYCTRCSGLVNKGLRISPACTHVSCGVPEGSLYGISARVLWTYTVEVSYKAGDPGPPAATTTS